jgi:osmoprotectant transport system ATP-binding protein
MIEFTNVSKSYGSNRILKDLTFSIRPGEFVVLIGPSGCGKTTTLKTINRLIEPDSGEIKISGTPIRSQNPVELRRSIGYVIQQIGLFPNMTVEQNIAVVPKLLKTPKEQWQQSVRELLELVGMPYEENAHKYPSELSGGQQQRIGVLRALAASPPIVLMDEPFGALDPITRDSLQDEVKKLQTRLKKTIVFVTHDMEEALRLADTIVFMNEGEIVQMASPEEMLRNPSSDLIRDFMGRHTGRYNEQPDLFAEDLMRTRVLKVPRSLHTLECVDRMSRREVNSVIVLNEDETFLGTVSLDTVRERGKAGREIGELVSCDIPGIERRMPAQKAFDLLLNSAASYLVVLNPNQTVAGIVTKTSMAKAMGEALWGAVLS